jgi:hypothetical protein
MTHKTYLGDGLYATFDGWDVTLTAPLESGIRWVVLEPMVLDNFLSWIESLKPKNEQTTLQDKTWEPGL